MKARACASSRRTTKPRTSRPSSPRSAPADPISTSSSWTTDRRIGRWRSCRGSGCDGCELPDRLGIGSAMRAGLRYALRQGYDMVIRIDGDGQHRADDIDALLDGRLGQPRRHRDRHRDITSGGATRKPRVISALANLLSTLTGRRVTDPTSGFYALGPRAMRMLAEHHPTGYPEPELRLFLRRNALSVVEVGVRPRSRLTGRTSLTTGRLATAAARVALAMVIVPLRRRVREAAHV